jgi:predicted transcriptional regulator
LFVSIYFLVVNVFFPVKNIIACIKHKKVYNHSLNEYEKEIAMTQSPLETYIEIINLLEREGPSNLIDIRNMTNLNCFSIKEKLGFLIKQGLVEEQTFGKARIFFAVTQKGLIVRKYFQGQENTPLIVTETLKQGHPPLEKQLFLNFT